MTGSRRFQPTVAMTLATAVAFVILLCLGTWQVQRLIWKTGVLAQVEARQSLPPAALPVDLTEEDYFRTVTIDGSFLPVSDRLFGVKSAGGAAGFGLLQPFETDEGTIVVLRGHVAQGETVPTLLSGPTQVVGQVRRAGWQGSRLFKPVNSPDAEALVYIEPSFLEARWGVDLRDALYIELQAPLPETGRYPIPVQSKLDIPNNHLSYAITWYSFAGILLVIYVLRSLRRKEEEDG